MINYTFHEMNPGQFAVWFFIYSFLGWCMECIVIRHQLGRWENRGFAKLPFCVIYGFGAFFALNLFEPIKNNYLLLYIASSIGATAFEFVVAKVMLKLFGEVWWNYEHLPFNYKGILCLQSTLGWGFVGVFIVGFLNKVLEAFVKSLDLRFVTILGAVLTVSYVIDFSFNFTKRLSIKRRLAKDKKVDNAQFESENVQANAGQVK